MRRIFLAVSVLAAGACVDVPDAVRAQFAPPRPEERSNFRPGRSGTAPPVEDPPAEKAAEPDAGAVLVPVPDDPGALDGGPLDEVDADADAGAASEPSGEPSGAGTS